MKIIAFNGSPRKNGNTALMLQYLLARVEKAGIESEVVQIGGKKLQGCLAQGQLFSITMYRAKGRLI